ncbi:MAG: MarR family transcriptional regulator [Gemmatimonadaceae bacterium]
MASGTDLGILLGLAYQSFTDELRASLLADGFDDLGSAYGYVFRALATESLQLTELAKRLGITAQGASKIITEMESRGYVERRPDEVDGRVKEILLAARGRKALAAARKFHVAYERRLTTKLGEDRVSAAREMFDAMIARTGSTSTPLRAI